VNLRVAERTGLVLRSLIVERWDAGRSSVGVRRVTTETEEVDVIDLQQPWVRRAVRRVARHAAFVGLHRGVLKDERAHGVGVALGADGELSGGGANLVSSLGSVRIVAVAALNQPDIDAMAIGACELGALRGVTAIAEFRLRLDQQEIHVSRFVRAVAGGATDAVGQVFRLGEVLRLRARLMALGADGRSLRRAQGFEADDLRDIAPAVNVRLRRAVTSLASVLVALQQCRMRRVEEVLGPNFFVTGLADIIIGVDSARLPGREAG